jgi:hypothetical protein
MQSAFATRLAAALSAERLAAYQQRLGPTGDHDLFACYAWNMALSEAFYPSLQVLEVALRNTIHKAVSRQARRSDWYDDPGIIRFPTDRDMVNQAKNNLAKKQKPLDPGRVVAELSFGFWTSLLDRRYEQVLWPALLKACFPYMPRAIRTRANISRRFQRIRTLRNRIFHHEPIWYWQDLRQQHADILEAIAWIEPAARDLVAAVDNFPAVYGTGLDAIRQNLRKFC